MIKECLVEKEDSQLCSLQTPNGLCPLSLEQKFRFLRIMDKVTMNLEDTEPFDVFTTKLEGNEEKVYPIPVSFGSQKLLAIPSTIKICHWPLFQSGKLLGIDMSSVCAVEALQLSRENKVLDLCCAPGTKLAVIADLIGEEGRVVGVDVVPHRLDIARSLMRKYGFKNVGLVLGNGCEPLFENKDSLAKSMGGLWNQWTLPYTRERKKRAWRKRSPQVLSSDASFFLNFWDTDGQSTELFDRVLVDVECSHDGSPRHVEKFIRHHGRKSYIEKISDPTHLKKLEKLQRALLCSGIRYCKEGGVIVYSTCSLMPCQNEQIVRYALDKFRDAICVIPLPSCLLQNHPECSIYSISLPINEENDSLNASPDSPCACLFHPQLSGSSGLFICALKKKKSSNSLV